MRNKVIALMLVVVMIIGMVPVVAYADSGVDDNADTGGIAGGLKSGNMVETQTGYRMYLADRNTGNQVSNVLDIVFGNNYPKSGNGMIATGTKLDGTLKTGFGCKRVAASS